MERISRRVLVGSAAFAGLGRRLARAAAPLAIGVTDWNLRLGANPEALPLARRAPNPASAVDPNSARRLIRSI